MKKISFIFVNYNVKEFLNTAINSVKKATVDFITEIIVVDNASVDGSPEFFKVKHPDITYIYNEENKGFGKANNQGLEIATGEFFVILNPDTIINEDTISNLIEFFDKTPEAGMAGCKVLNPDGTLQLACRRSFPGPWVSFTRVTGLSKFFPKSKLFAKYNLTYLDENKTYEVDAISGSFMMMRREVYEKIGGFDPVFFMYGEDIDLCFRTQQAGYKVFYVHTTEIIHFKGESTKRSSLDEAKIFYEAMHLFVKKHLSSSFIVAIILRSAIILRRFFAFVSSKHLAIMSIVLDFFFYSLAVLFAESIYHPNNWLGFPDETKPYVYILPAVFQIIISFLVGTYKKKSLSNFRILISLLVGMTLLSSFTFFFKQFAYSRAIILIVYGLSFVVFSLWRIIYKIIFREKLSNITRKNKSVIIGTSQKAVKFAEKIRKSYSNVQHVLGLISTSSGEIGEKRSNIEVIGSIETLGKVISEYKLDKVIFLSDELSFQELFGIVSKFYNDDVEFVIAGSDQDFIVGKSSITMLDNIPLLKLDYNISDSAHILYKRILDILLSVPLMVFILPFVYLCQPLLKKKSEFLKFIKSVPKVFFGKLSFVGPKDNAYYSDLYLGKIGLTGLWFIEQFNKDDREELIKLNVFYARNQNVWLDLEIIGRTFSKFFNS